MTVTASATVAATPTHRRARVDHGVPMHVSCRQRCRSWSRSSPARGGNFCTKPVESPWNQSAQV